MGRDHAAHLARRGSNPRLRAASRTPQEYAGSHGFAEAGKANIKKVRSEEESGSPEKKSWEEDGQKNHQENAAAMIRV
jgi:hypothetical protein